METQQEQQDQEQEQLEVADNVAPGLDPAADLVEEEAWPAWDGESPSPDAELDEWKAHARKWEDRAKKGDRGDQRAQAKRAKLAEKERDKLAAQLKEHEDADRSEQDKAIEAAREEGRTAALTEAQVERRQDRLEVAATRLAAKGVAVGEGDDARTLKFADPDDALVHVERAIRSGDVDEDDIYDENNKVKTDGLRSALEDILERKPHLVAKAPEQGRPQGSSDAGRGAGGGKSLEEMTPEDHYKALQGD